MNHIEEMMKTAGCMPEKRFKECKENAKNIGLCHKYPCIKCESSVFVDKYPDFTAEKQLEIIKLIIKDDVIGFFKITQGLSKDYILFYNNCRAQHKDFTQALAQLTTELMKAGELDKDKVKEVLES